MTTLVELERALSDEAHRLRPTAGFESRVLAVLRRDHNQFASLRGGSRISWRVSRPAGSQQVVALVAVVLAFTIVATLIMSGQFRKAAVPSGSPSTVLKGTGTYPISDGNLSPFSRQNSFYFSPNDAVAVVNGHPLVTHDAGKTWLTTPGTWFYGSLEWIDVQHIYFWGLQTSRSTIGGIVFEETSDGGRHWQLISAPNQASFDPTVSFFINPNEGWTYLKGCLSLAQCEIGQTTDAGRHWTPIASVGDPQPGVMVFTDGLHGFLGSNSYRDDIGRLYKTRDGGVTWSLIVLPAPPGGWRPGINSVHAPQMFGSSGVLIDQLAVGPLVAYSTADGGATWGSPRALPSSVATDATPTFIDPNEGWVVDQDGHVLRTIDGARSWQTVATNANGQAFDLVVPVGDHVIWGEVGSADRYLVRSTDDGLSWSFVTLPKP